MYPGQTPIQGKVVHHKTLIDCLGLEPKSLICLMTEKFKLFSIHRSAIYDRALLSGAIFGFGHLDL